MGSKSGQAGDWTRAVYQDNRLIRASGRGCGESEAERGLGVGADPVYFSLFVGGGGLTGWLSPSLRPPSLSLRQSLSLAIPTRLLSILLPPQFYSVCHI